MPKTPQQENTRAFLLRGIRQKKRLDTVLLVSVQNIV